MPEVLLELELGVGNDPGGHLPDLPPRRVRVVHLDLHPGPSGLARLQEVHLAGGADLSFDGVPRYGAVVFLLGGLGLPLEGLAEGALDPPVGGVGAGGGGLLDLVMNWGRFSRVSQ